MAKKIFEGDYREGAALLVRMSIQTVSCRQVAGHLGKSDSLINKWTEGEEPQVVNLEQWLKTLEFSRDFDGVRRLAEECGFVCVRRGASLAEALRELAKEVERQEGQA